MPVSKHTIVVDFLLYEVGVVDLLRVLTTFETNPAELTFVLTANIRHDRVFKYFWTGIVWFVDSYRLLQSQFLYCFKCVFQLFFICVDIKINSHEQIFDFGIDFLVQREILYLHVLTVVTLCT